MPMMPASKRRRPSQMQRTLHCLVASFLSVSLLVAACTDAADSPDDAVGREPTITPIVITIALSPTPVPIPPPTATLPPTATSVPSPTTPPTPRPTATAIPPTLAPTAAPTAAPRSASTATPETAILLGPLVNHNVAMPEVPISATTGITSTTQFSLTEVPPPVPPVKLPPGTINIALLGLDTRPNGGSSLSDVIIIASINPNTPAVTLLSIPRDTLVYIPNRKMAKVNTAFASSPDVFKQTILYNFGLNVDYYATINFAGIVNAVNTLGGIDIVATCPLYQVFPKDPYYMADPITPLTVTVPYTDTFTGEVWEPGQPVPTQTINLPRPGVYTLNGQQALAFARARYGVPGGDIDRGRRAQQVVRALLNKARSNGVITLTQLPALLNQFSRHVKTDLTLDQILALVLQADRFDDGVIRSRYFDGVGLTGLTLPEAGSVLIPDRANIAPYLQQALGVPLNQRAGSGIPIEVWNGTRQPGFGQVAASRLRELGFEVISVQETDETYAKTQVIDFTTTAKGSAIPLLQRTFGIKAENIIAQPNPDGPRYRIIAGQDFDPCYHRTTPPSVRYQTVATPMAPTDTAADPAATADAIRPEATPLPPVIVDPNQPPVTQEPPAEPTQPPEPTPDPNAPPP